MKKTICHWSGSPTRRMLLYSSLAKGQAKQQGKARRNSLRRNRPRGGVPSMVSRLRAMQPVVLCVLLLVVLPLRGEVAFQDLLKLPAENWLSYSGDLTARRYSMLKQINTTNVNNLVPQWVYHVKESKRLQGTPLVVDGVMYVSHTNEVYALDASTGREIWH